MKFPYIFNRFSFNFLVISWIVAFVAFWAFFFYIGAIEYYETATYGTGYGIGTGAALVSFFILCIYLTFVSIIFLCLLLLEKFSKFRIKNQKFLNLYNNIFIRVLTVIMAIMQIGCCIFALIGLLELFDYI